MADTNTLNLNITAGITKVFDADSLPTASAASNRTVKHDCFTYSPTAGDVTLDNLVVYEHTLDGASDEIDLTSVSASEGSDSGDLTGKKVYAVFIYPSSENSGDTTVGPGDSNAYPLFGSGNDITVPKGAKFVFYDPTVSLAAVSATIKTIKISGTDGDTCKIGLLLT